MLQQRIAAGEVTLYKVDDPNMTADLLTKWIPRDKLKASIQYAANSRAAVGDVD